MTQVITNKTFRAVTIKEAETSSLREDVAMWEQQFMQADMRREDAEAERDHYREMAVRLAKISMKFGFVLLALDEGEETEVSEDFDACLQVYREIYNDPDIAALLEEGSRRE